MKNHIPMRKWKRASEKSNGSTLVTALIIRNLKKKLYRFDRHTHTLAGWQADRHTVVIMYAFQAKDFRDKIPLVYI